MSATFPKFNVPGLMPNMAQSKRFRAINAKKKNLFKLSQQEQKENNCNPGSKLTGHLQNVVLQFIVALLLFPQPHLSVIALLRLSRENLPCPALPFPYRSVFLTCFEHSKVRKS